MDIIDLSSQLENIICQVLSCTGEEIARARTLVDLGLDSIGLITLICIIEDKYQISIPEQDLFEIKCFSDLVTKVRDLLLQ